ncbi:hypothetical protein C8Q80DRAFT_1219861 [Daedaleopsis nitida]|nr:hypothetical protein C8Q80DRAFT_1219861 [Daedaleopsis nitida]
MIIAWRFCHTHSNSKVEELLMELKQQFTLLGVAKPKVVIADNCCHVKSPIKRMFPQIAVCLDVWHFMMWYLICIINSRRNPHRSQVARDVVSAILKSTAKDGAPMVYWKQNKQEVHLQEVYMKWKTHGDVWAAAAQKVHLEQFSHVQKGCLARPVMGRGASPGDNVRSDGSQIEGTHKGWNGLQQLHASSLENPTYLCHNFVNHSHHLCLTNAASQLWNMLVCNAQTAHLLSSNINPLPERETIASGDMFGLMKMSILTAAHYAMATIKEEPDEDSNICSTFSGPANFFAPHSRAPIFMVPSSIGPQLPMPKITSMTQSQCLLSIATGIDPHTFSYPGSEAQDIFMFIMMHDQHKWVLYQMLPFDWICTASAYNTEIDKLNAVHGKDYPIKLNENKGKILHQIKSNDHRSGMFVCLSPS